MPRPPESTPSAAAERAVWIDRGDALERAARRWLGEPVVAVDTEFVRERTFHPHLGLIQVGDRRGAALIDPVALADLSPLDEVLQAPSVIKVLHSASEDLEVFHRRFGAVPTRLVDTQVAAALTGRGMSISYRDLVAEIESVTLDKGETRTNWLRRPLSAAQKRYAALDVIHLLPIYDVLAAEIERRGRGSWLAEEMAALADVEGRLAPDPDALFGRLARSAGLDRRRLAVLRGLCAWREAEARRRDLPRNFVVKQPALVEIARRRPRRREDLAAIQALPEGQARRFAGPILRTIREAMSLPEDALPQPPPRARDLAKHKGRVAELRNAVTAAAARLEVPPELLATRRTVESLVRRWLEHGRKTTDDILPKELRGWRRDAVGEHLLELLRAA